MYPTRCGITAGVLFVLSNIVRIMALGTVYAGWSRNLSEADFAANRKYPVE